MAIEIQWYMEKRIIYSRFIDAITISTISQGSDIIATMVAEGDAPVHVILDAQELVSVPPNIRQLSQASDKVFSHDAVGVIIMIVKNPIQRFLGNLVLQLFGKTGKIVKTHEEGLATLQRLDILLTDLPPEPPQHSDVIRINEDVTN